ncbi:hypothetical protein ccbrp13_31000 [Ktedonobacteria bacterium brp13]|nr:hypothetical protein ccbrp13_31000 [Ktedonobacteria bacterium brp13]
MKKEEFPTFLNEQPTVVLGRTSRELLIMLCGCVAGYVLYEYIGDLSASALWGILSIVISCIPAVLAIAVALIYIGKRPLEEWFAAWAVYALSPKIYLYKPIMDSPKDELQAAKTKQSPRKITKNQKIQRMVNPGDENFEAE